MTSREQVADAERRVHHELSGDDPSVSPRARRTAVVAGAALLFALIFATRMVIGDPSALIANFYAIPIALLAAEFGVRAGLAAAACAFVLVWAWGVLRDVHLGLLGYSARAFVFVTVGLIVGAYSERVQRDLRLRRAATRELELRADELERSNERLALAVTRLEALGDIARSVGGETDLERVLGVIVDRARAVVGVRALLICLPDRGALRVAATSGPGRDKPLPTEGWPLAAALDAGAPLRITAPEGSTVELAPGIEARAAILAPLDFRGRRLGVLAALDRVEDGPGFDAEDERLVATLAASAATAVATAQSVARDRLRDSIEASEQARARWARELHDETLQGLFGLRMALSSARRAATREDAEAAIAAAADQTKREIVNLRVLIAELRPAALDELGLGPAIETLADRSAASAALEVDTRVELGGARERLSRETESTVYRVVQESLTNVAKHAAAARVQVCVECENGTVEVTVEDDGRGFDPAHATDGLGLAGMRERVELSGGRLEIRSRAGGTLVHAQLPATTGS